MSEIRTVTTLRAKRKEIAASIQLYERQIAQAYADLAQVEAPILIFEASGSRKAMTSYHDTHRLFGRREKIERVKAARAKHGPLDTRELHEGRRARPQRPGDGQERGANPRSCPADASAAGNAGHAGQTARCERLGLTGSKGGRRLGRPRPMLTPERCRRLARWAKPVTGQGFL